ncbi:hypothetical protein MHYP_G00253170 [Metynnis hypsauchen]
MAKRRKVDDECRAFQEKWRTEYFFVEVKGKPVCLICREALAVLKKSNIERHHTTRHASYTTLQGAVQAEKIKALKNNLLTQQASFTRPKKELDSVTEVSYVVSELIAKRLRPYSEGEFVKECMVAAAQVLAPEKLKLFQNVSLSRRTMSDRIGDMAQDIEKSLKDSVKDFEFCSLALDETTDITNTSQLAIFVRGIMADFNTREDLLSLVGMHDTTKDVMATVVSCVNFIKSRGLNNRQFKEFLKSLETDYGDLVYYCEVRWLSRANMLKRFYELRDAFKSFMETKGKCNEKLNDVKWICDLAFMVDITSYLSELNVKLQGPNQLLVSLLSHVKSFEAKLKLWQVQLARGNVGHFPTLQNHNPVPERTKEYANECTYLLEAFAQRFQDVKAKEQDLNIFATPFNVNVADVPECMQLEIIELQNNCQLKARHSNMDLLEFYKQNISACEFPNLRKHALKMASLFGTTYRCEQLFSKLSHAKNQLRLTDTHLENQLRVATASLPPDISQLVKTKHSQPSH